MLGFDTIGNATLIAYDGEPVIATDPWMGEPAYFGSWGLPFDIPEEQRQAILRSKYVWLSHGHPDHLNPDSLNSFQGQKILLPDHEGNRIRDDLTEQGFDVTVLKSGDWISLSDNIRVYCISDYFQDAVLLVDVGGTLLVNLNDATDRGWGRRVKRIVRQADRSFLLKLFGYGDVDMMNFIDDNANRITPDSVRKRSIGQQIAFFAKLYGTTDVVPFSCFHIYQRRDSLWANTRTTPLEAFYEDYSEADIALHPAFIRYNAETGEISELNPSESVERVYEPEEFGDNWTDPLEKMEMAEVEAYFRQITTLENQLDFINVRVGGTEVTIDMSRRRSNRGLTFEAPRHSLLTAIRYEIFDDLLIGNFMKTQLHGNWEAESLHPHFTPYVAKYADNGRVKSDDDLDEYFKAYRRRAPISFIAHVLERESERRVRKLVRPDSPTFRLAKKAYLFLKRA